MIILFDKNTDPNIAEISSGDVNGDKFYWNVRADNGWVWDITNFKFRAGGSDANVVFHNAEGFEPYFQQYMGIVAKVVNPAVKFNEDPYYDRTKTGEIVPHTYDTTSDIEQEYIAGTFKE